MSQDKSLIDQLAEALGHHIEGPFTDIEQEIHRLKEGFFGSLDSLQSRLTREARNRLHGTLTEAASAIAGNAAAAIEERYRSRMTGMIGIIRRILSSHTQAEILTNLADGAAQFCSRAVLFVSKGDYLIAWETRGFNKQETLSSIRSTQIPKQSDTTLAQACNELCPVEGTLDSRGENAQLAQRLGGEQPDKILCLPVVIRDKAAAVLYADSIPDFGNALNREALSLLVETAQARIELQALEIRMGIKPVRPSVKPPVTAPKAEIVTEPGKPVEAVAAPVSPPAPAEVIPPVPAPAQPERVPEAVPEPVIEPVKIAPEPEPAAVVPEPVAEPVKITPEPEPAAVAPEPVAEPVKIMPEPEPAAVVPEPVAEPVKITPEPEPTVVAPELVVEPVKITSEPEPAAVAPEPETTAILTSPPISPPRHVPEVEVPPAPVFSTSADLEATTRLEMQEIPHFGAAAVDSIPAEVKAVQYEPLPTPAVAESESPAFEAASKPVAAPESAVLPDDAIEIDLDTIFSTESMPSPGAAGAAAEETRRAADFASQPLTPVLDQTSPLPPPIAASIPPTPAPPAQKAGPATVPELERLHSEAKRFARLLASEIKLYNEQAVNDGRRHRDIYDRLKKDIDRSRALYDQRVSEQVARRVDYFHDELVRVLGANDPTALGSDYPGPRMVVND